MNQRAKYIGHRLYSPKVIIQTDRQTHTGTNAVPGPLNYHRFTAIRQHNLR